MNTPFSFIRKPILDADLKSIHEMAEHFRKTESEIAKFMSRDLASQVETAIKRAISNHLGGCTDWKTEEVMHRLRIEEGTVKDFKIILMDNKPIMTLGKAHTIMEPSGDSLVMKTTLAYKVLNDL